MRSVTFTVPIKPKPKDRPRMTRRGRAFTPKKTTVVEDDMAVWINDWMDEHSAEPFMGPTDVSVRLFSDRHEITVTERVGKSKLRGDVDNYVKLVLDALQKSDLMENDNLVMKVTAIKETR